MTQVLIDEQLHLEIWSLIQLLEGRSAEISYISCYTAEEETIINKVTWMVLLQPFPRMFEFCSLRLQDQTLATKLIPHGQNNRWLTIRERENIINTWFNLMSIPFPFGIYFAGFRVKLPINICNLQKSMTYWYIGCFCNCLELHVLFKGELGKMIVGSLSLSSRWGKSTV
jgi:hypothetical protein